LEHGQEAQALAWIVTLLRRNIVQSLVEASFQVKRVGRWLRRFLPDKLGWQDMFKPLGRLNVLFPFQFQFKKCFCKINDIGKA
jgi:hypothetical protein